jgi:hypothetical protein
MSISEGGEPFERTCRASASAAQAPIVEMTSYQRPSATCRGLRGSAWQRAMANGHRGWKWQPLGGARARISPLIGAKIRRRCSICAIS